jgi:hypothetical protein
MFDVEEAVKNAVRGFAKWFAEEWPTTREQWEREYADLPPDGDWFDGHNAGVKGVLLAVDMFLDEVGP